jgi:glycosyltransferase involved in cell wall biosynthesis
MLRRKVRFDLAHQLNPVYTGISLALFGSGIPVVLGPYVADWPHDPQAIRSSRRAINAVLRRAKEAVAFFQQRNASAILLTTDAASRRVSFAHCWKAPVHYLPHGIDSDFFRPGAPETRFSRDDGHTAILFYANISERKGVMDVLCAFEMIAPEFPMAELWIAGEGDQLNAARNFASNLGAQNRILFLGRQTREQAVLLMQHADLFCLASHGEPYGMTVVEAMSCGLPVVVTDAGGARYLAGDEGGLRVPMKSPAALALALARLLADPQSRLQMGLRNRQKVLHSFAWDKVIDRLEEIYSLTIEGKRESQIAVHIPNIQMADGLSTAGERR